jgi:hypothetical protein
MQSKMPISNDQASKLSTLVNLDAIRSSIKRLFHNRIDEVISEILQNSQRSGSTCVDITTTENSFTIHDNGHGLLDGIDGFHTLLKLAESNFDNDTIDDQDPMGIGIVSLLTHDQVNEVTFSSGSLELTIDTKRWWNEPGYYSKWFERLVTRDQPITGFRIFATCSPELVKALHTALAAKDQISPFDTSVLQCSSPAQGYDGILTVSLDQKPVRTTLPRWTRLADLFISTTYKGCKLEIGYDSSRSRSSVLWYGQLIMQRGILDDFHFHLEVKSGRPINPLSPTRAGIIQDASYNELIEFIKDKLFTFIFNPENRYRIKPAHIRACYKIDASYSITNCPYIIAESVKTNPTPDSFQDFNSTSEYLYSKNSFEELFTYDKLPQLLHEHVIIELPDKRSEAEHGLRSFLRETGPAHFFRLGDESRVTIGTLWWRPTGDPKHECFYQPGQCGISYQSETPPTTWTAITTTPVFVFNDTSSYDAWEVDFIVGTSDDPVNFYRTEAWAGYSPHDESDHDPQAESYGESLDDIIRSLIGKCVPKDFKLHEIGKFLKDPSAPIVSITYHYKIAGKFVNPRKAYKPNSKGGAAMPPAEVTVKTSTGERIRLKLY